jgi:hypothetical protein
MKPFLICVLACAGLMAQTQWAKEPTSFLGVPFDSNLHDASVIVVFGTCYEKKNDKDCDLQYYLTPERFTNFHFRFHNDRFVFVSGEFINDDYQQVKDLFVERYGKPMSSNDGRVQGDGGGVFRNDTLYWTGRKMFLSLSKYGSTVDEGTIQLALHSYTVEKDREDAKTRKKAASGF